MRAAAALKAAAGWPADDFPFHLPGFSYFGGTLTLDAGIQELAVRSFWRDNGLTLVLAGLFLFSMAGMIWSGHSAHNEELRQHGGEAVSLITYVTSGSFLSALFENWESEFLQMACYVVLTAMLYQRGSAKSRDPDDPFRPDDQLPREMRKRSPLMAWLYSYSLGIALALLFVASFSLHWWSSLIAANDEAIRHGGEVKSAIAYVFEAQLWFEILPELAIRIPVDSSSGRAVRFPAAQGIARIQAGRRPEQRNRSVGCKRPRAAARWNASPDLPPWGTGTSCRRDPVPSN